MYIQKDFIKNFQEKIKTKREESGIERKFRDRTEEQRMKEEEMKILFNMRKCIKICILYVLYVSAATLPIEAQDENPGKIILTAGASYNQSNREFMTTTGIGIFLEMNYRFSDRIQFGYRFEPTALAYGELILPGGCDGECREGANYVLNNYFMFNYFPGQVFFGPNGVGYRSYAGLSMDVLSHKRWIITSRETGNWKDTHKWFANPGVGLRLGMLAGRFDISVAYHIAGRDFQDYVGFGLGYRIFNF